MRILIVEDEEHIADGLKFNLEAEGFETEIAADGHIALEKIHAARNSFDAIVLDVMLPEIDGFEVAKTIRSEENFTPILMLTARSRPEDVLRGFESGADDYLPKPFELNIFLARLNGLIRRREWFARERLADGASKTSIAALVKINGREIDFANLEIRNKRDIVRLTLMEAKLLRYLIAHENEIVSRKEILEKVWELNEETDTRAIDNFIVRLRKYLEVEPNKPQILQTVRGVGYRYVAQK